MRKLRLEDEISIDVIIDKQELLEKLTEANYYLLEAIRLDDRLKVMKYQIEYNNLLKIYMK